MRRTCAETLGTIKSGGIMHGNHLIATDQRAGVSRTPQEPTVAKSWQIQLLPNMTARSMCPRRVRSEGLKFLGETSQ